MEEEDVQRLTLLQEIWDLTMARRGEFSKVKLSRRCIRFRAGDVERFIERKAAVNS